VRQAPVGADATVDHLETVRERPDLRLDPEYCVSACRADNSARANVARGKHTSGGMPSSSMRGWYD
jgi:hypothetical protein